MCTNLQKTLAKHCGPVLLNKKPATLLSLPRAERKEVLALSGNHIKAAVLRFNQDKDLLLLYQPQLLEAALMHEEAVEILTRFDYPLGQGLARIIHHLRLRISASAEFPHEVGLFLGYPVADVAGFIEHKGHNYKIAGDWKVYGSVHLAQNLFVEHRKCRNYLLHYVENGGNLHSLCFNMTSG